MTTNLTHVVLSRDATGSTRIYVNGVLVEAWAAGGDLSTWDVNYMLALANAPGGGRPWLGELHLVAVYGRALTILEVQQNLNAGVGTASLLPNSHGLHLAVSSIPYLFSKQALGRKATDKYVARIMVEEM